MVKEFGFCESRLIGKIDRLNSRLRQKNVGNDIDNTEVATSANGILILNKRFKTNFKPDDLKYDFAIIDLIKKNLPEIEDSGKLANEIWNSEENIREAKPVAGAIIVSKFLSECGINNIHRISSRPGKLHDITLSWYEANMPWVDRSLIHIQPDGNEINSRFKINQIKEQKIDIFFEDSVEHAETISLETKATVVLIPQDSNSYYKSHDNKIVVVPRYYHSLQPNFVRAYLWLAEIYG